MINNVSILLSLLATGYVILRAIRLDRTLPWFGSPPAPTVPPPVAPPGGPSAQAKRTR